MMDFNSRHVDPNVAGIIGAFEENDNVRVVWTHLTPETILANTEKKYSAIYRDDHGSYPFEIKKKGDKYRVTVQGNLLYTRMDRERLLWEFENQLGSMADKVACI